MLLARCCSPGMGRSAGRHIEQNGPGSYPRQCRWSRQRCGSCHARVSSACSPRPQQKQSNHWRGVPIHGVADDLRVSAANVQHYRVGTPGHNATHFDVCVPTKRVRTMHGIAAVHTNSNVRPTQWLTATIGFFHSWPSIRAHTAHDASGAPIPGPAPRTPRELHAERPSSTGARTTCVANDIDVAGADVGHGQGKLHECRDMLRPTR